MFQREGITQDQSPKVRERTPGAQEDRTLIGAGTVV